MPPNLITVAIAWLATHLVLFTLLGFVLAGLFLAGVIGTPGQGQPATAGRLDADVMPAISGHPGDAGAKFDENRAVLSRPQASGKPYPTKGVGEVGDDSREPARKQPRLIGGSLPIYDQSRFKPSKSGPLPGEGNGAFRPPGEGSPSGPLTVTRDDLLQDARRAFWNGDFEAAEAAYMALVSEYPADADAFGELGNLYQAMGKPKLALDAYFEAALRLQAVGERERLTEMVELLRREGDGRADRFTP